MHGHLRLTPRSRTHRPLRSRLTPLRGGPQLDHVGPFDMHDTLAKCILAFDAGLAECHRSEDRVLVSTYLAALAPVLAKCTVGSDVLGDLQSIERLFGNSWVIDEKPFLAALNFWREFK